MCPGIYGTPYYYFQSEQSSRLFSVYDVTYEIMSMLIRPEVEQIQITNIDMVNEIVLLKIDPFNKRAATSRIC